MGPRIGPKSALAPKGHPEAAEALQGPFGDQFWVTFGPHLGPILEFSEADFQATATATAATAVATPTTTATANATSRLRAFSSGAFGFTTVVWGVSPTGTEAATASWSFAFELFDQGSLGFSSGGSWALAWAWGHGL